jgi:hypothetical protein
MPGAGPGLVEMGVRVMRKFMVAAAVFAAFGLGLAAGVKRGAVRSGGAELTMEQEASDVTRDHARAWERHRERLGLRDGTPEWERERAAWRAAYKEEMADAYRRRGKEPPAWAVRSE